MARGSARSAALDQKRFHDSIFKGMKSQRYQSSARFEHTLGRDEACGKFGQLVVDEDAQRLERPRGGMDRAPSRVHDTRDDISERAGGVDRGGAPRSYDGTGDAARVTLFAKRGDNGCK